MNKKILLLFMAILLAMPGVIAQTVEIEHVTNAEPGLVQVDVNLKNFTGVGAISLFIEYDQDLLTYTGSPFISFGGGTIFVGTAGPGNQWLSVSWFNPASPGVNFSAAGIPKFVTLDFNYAGGIYTELKFTSGLTTNFCEVATWSGTVLKTNDPNHPEYDPGAFLYGSITPTDDNDGDAMLGLGAIEATAGDMVEVPVYLDDFAVGAYAIELRVAYPTDKLTYTGFSDNSLGFSVAPSAGMIVLSKTSAEAMSFPTQQQVIILKFTYQGVENAPLNFASGSIVNGLGGNILKTKFANGMVIPEDQFEGTLVIESVIAGDIVNVPVFENGTLLLPGNVNLKVTASDFVTQVGTMTLKMAYDTDKLAFKYAIPVGSGWNILHGNGVITASRVNYQGFTPVNTVLTLNFDIIYDLSEDADIVFVPGTILQKPNTEFIPVDLVDGGIIYSIPIVVTEVEDDSKLSCDFGNQQQLNEHFDNWIGGFSIDGGCAADDVHDWNGVYPDLCETASIKVKWTVTDTCNPDEEYEATFTLTAPVAITYDDPESETKSSCEFANQDALNAAFDLWLTSQHGDILTSIQNGCVPQLAHDWVGAYPVLCEASSVTVKWTITDLCENIVDEIEATFTVTVPDAITYVAPVDDERSSCEFDSQQEVLDAFTAWVTAQTNALVVDNGCDPQVSDNSAGVTIPVWCTGGDVEVTWTISDKCETIPLKATWELTAAPAVVLNVPENKELDPCQAQSFYEDEFAAWIALANFDGGCSATWTMTTTAPVLPDLCGGGVVTVTWTVTSECADPVVETSSFTVEPGKLGDVNCDGQINALDITRMVLFINETPSPATFCFSNADAFPDGVINGIDVSAVITIINQQP